MIPQEFNNNNNEKKKMNFKGRPEVAQIRHIEENRLRTEMGKRGLESREGTKYLN